MISVTGIRRSLPPPPPHHLLEICRKWVTLPKESVVFVLVPTRMMRPPRFLEVVVVVFGRSACGPF